MSKRAYVSLEKLRRERAGFLICLLVVEYVVCVFKEGDRIGMVAIAVDAQWIAPDAPKAPKTSRVSSMPGKVGARSARRKGANQPVAAARTSFFEDDALDVDDGIFVEEEEEEEGEESGVVGLDNALRQYLAEIGRSPLLTAEQELSLACRVVLGETEALQQLVEANLRLVVDPAGNQQGCGRADAQHSRTGAYRRANLQVEAVRAPALPGTGARTDPGGAGTSHEILKAADYRAPESGRDAHFAGRSLAG